MRYNEYARRHYRRKKYCDLCGKRKDQDPRDRRHHNFCDKCHRKLKKI